MNGSALSEKIFFRTHTHTHTHECVRILVFVAISMCRVYAYIREQLNRYLFIMGHDGCVFEWRCSAVREDNAGEK